jgi:hypothetical protein
MQRLLEQISREHYPKPPATPQEVAAFEQRVGWRLDEDLRAFYLHCDGAELFKRRPDCPYRFLALSEITRARVAMRGEDSDEAGPASLYTLPRYCRQIADNFAEFLAKALRSGGTAFWLGEHR